MRIIMFYDYVVANWDIKLPYKYIVFTTMPLLWAYCITVIPQGGFLCYSGIYTTVNKKVCVYYMEIDDITLFLLNMEYGFFVVV